MQALVDRFSIVMVVGVVAIVALSQINRLLGSVLGVFFWAVMALAGTVVYQNGGAVGIASVRFPQSVFLGVCGLLIVANAATGVRAFQRKRAQANAAPADPAE